MPYRISRLGLVEIRSLDLDRDLDYYLNVLGLQLTAREGKTAYMKGWDERHAYSFALTESDRAGMVRMAFRTVDPEDLDYYEKRLKEFDVKYDVIREDYRRGRALRFTAPSGHTVELQRNGLHGERPPDRESRAVARGPAGHRAAQARPYAGDCSRAQEGDRVLSDSPRVPLERDARCARWRDYRGLAVAAARAA
jgi:catechol 2,3-dioxygenase-like lactoylglutathione lyase family enzyme